MTPGNGNPPASRHDETTQHHIEVYVTTDTSAAPASKAAEARLYVMRDTASPDGPQLYFTEAEWRAFEAGVRDGEFDLDQSGELPSLS